VDGLCTKVDKMSPQIYRNERAIDEMEQYSRSNCLILHGAQIPTSTPTETLDPENQQVKHFEDMCEKHVLSVLNTKLCLPFKITSGEIDICHQLPSTKNKNPIIIKFVRRTVRNLVYSHKKDLKGKLDSNNKLSITESLTKRRLKLLEAARNVFLFNNVWTMQGRVHCKFNGHKHVIDDFCDISRIRFPTVPKA